MYFSLLYIICLIFKQNNNYLSILKKYQCFDKIMVIKRGIIMNLKNRHFLTLKDYSKEEIRYLLDLAHQLKADKKAGNV